MTTRKLINRDFHDWEISSPTGQTQRESDIVEGLYELGIDRFTFGLPRSLGHLLPQSALLLHVRLNFRSHLFASPTMSYDPPGSEMYIDLSFAGSPNHSHYYQAGRRTGPAAMPGLSVMPCRDN